MEIQFNVQIWREGTQFVAHAMPLDLASCGPTPPAARQALDEAVDLFLKTATEQGTLVELLEDAGYELVGADWRSPDWVAMERHSAALAA